ncbi:hypothetical protein COU95_02390 [Candidatus Shapirobacteria bacterium CG10_big_fil_rev_8_21_14_0_10_40_9]|uniref:Uncharacterized protein n=1 Tax=Candidatus Shapirobacteria bacterium CG10_big_fil_rev_8_21_14_0_10_40_9 TaxID=1974888 RepID=A0A2M8L3E7_9BACT|nr:MAG: hypothetical protein COU95_02390 [Candidatus Shapirobacteria bacterium CG10_big_fil_rev_8_21_14_0_10_40_9]
MPDPLKIPIRASTQEHLEIEDIKDNIIILKDGSCCLILATTAINFGLLSEKEQDALIYAYAALLNSLTFPIEIVIRSKRKDVTSYLKLLEGEILKQTNKLLQEQMKKYQKFVEDTVKKNNVLDKSFYVIIPFSTLELGATKALGAIVKRQKGLPYPKDYILERAKMNLYPKKDHLIRQFNRLGLKTKELTTQEAIQLFYDIYNPESGFQKLAAGQEYAAPIVQTL